MTSLLLHGSKAKLRRTSVNIDIVLIKEIPETLKGRMSVNNKDSI